MTTPIPYEQAVNRELSRKRRNELKWEEMKTFIYNSSKKEFCGRNFKSWIYLIAYHLVLYTGMVAIFVICLGLFSVTIDEIYPHLQDKNSALQGTPGMGYRPLMDHESYLVRFIQGKPGTYKPHTDSVQAFLDQYEKPNQNSENVHDCQDGPPPPGKVCYFNLDLLGNECTWQNDYGFDEGRPCFVLKLNKIYGWIPKEHKSADELPEAVRDRFSPNHMPVYCEGEGPLDKENIGNVTYLPPEGFPLKYYPYLNQEGYRAPLVMVKFQNVTNGMVINVICRTYAKNIKQNRNDQLGSITFSLLVD